MAVINLIDPARKRDIAAARANVRLLQYCVMIVSLAGLITLIYGAGFWLIHQDEQTVRQRLDEQSSQSAQYVEVEREAEAFRKNLTIAKRILGVETTYSTFLTTLGGDMPDGAVLTNLTIGKQPAVKGRAANAMTLQARAIDYATVLSLKSKLEESSLFEDVNILSTTRPDSIAGLSGLEAKYPYQATLNVKVSSGAAGAAQ